MRSRVLKAGLLIVLLLLCVGLPIVKAEGDVVVSWTSPTISDFWSVFMVGADDGWAVGGWGTILRWTGTEWIPEFSAATLMLVLINLTLVAVIVEKTVLRKSRRHQLPSKNQI